MQLVRVGNQQIALLSKQELFERKGAIRFLVLWRDGFRCVYCGQSRFEDRVWLNIDHVIPERNGGEYTLKIS